METGWIVALIGAIVPITAAASVVVKNWMDGKRESRKDEITVLHDSIAELRADRDKISEEMAQLHERRDAEAKARDAEMRALKDEHTACLIVQERLKIRVEYLEKQVLALSPSPVHCQNFKLKEPEGKATPGGTDGENPGS